VALANAGRVLSLATACLAGCVVLTSCGFQEPPLEPITREVLNRVEIPPIEGKTAVMDTMVIDPATSTLYVSDATDPTHEGVDVIDVHSLPGRYLKIISTGDTLPNGLVMAPDVHRLYTGNDDGTVSVIDIDPTSPHYQTIVATLNMNGKLAADLVDYDPVDHRVFVNSPDDAFMTAIDSRTNRIVGRINNIGLVDQPMYDPADGMLYGTAVDDNLLIKMDPRTLRVVDRYPLAVPCQPHGIAVNPRTNQGLIGCADKDEPVTISWDFAKEAPIRYFDLAGSGDLLVYDRASDRFIFAASSYAPAEMAVFSGSPISYLTSVPTSHKSHDVAYDDAHHAIFTIDGRIREAALWEFPDPLTRCDRALTHCTGEPNVPPPIDNGAPAKGR
jgi:hypothetical protein